MWWEAEKRRGRESESVARRDHARQSSCFADISTDQYDPKETVDVDNNRRLIIMYMALMLMIYK